MFEPFLREVAGDPVTVKAQIAELRLVVHRASSERERAVSLGRLGDLLRTVGDEGEAVAVLERAVGIDVDDTLVDRANRLRLATARFYAGDHTTAEDELRSLTIELESSDDPTYLDFAWQHLGKCLAEQSRWSEAVRCFERALRLREGGDPTLIRSSETALITARERLTVPP